MSKAAVAIFVSLVFIDVQLSRAGSEMNFISCDMVKIAEDELARQFPWFVAGKYPRLIEESGNRWTLTYTLPPDMIGGVPTIVLDKRTCGVLKVEHSQ